MPYIIDKISYNYDKGCLIKEGKEIKLTNLQKKLMNYFIDNPQQIHSKQKLMENVWGRVITENSVDQFISILRNYFEKDPSKPILFTTHFGKGISFEYETKIKNPTKNTYLYRSKVKIILLALVSFILIYFLLLTADTKKPVLQTQVNTPANRLIFITDDNNTKTTFNQSSATQMLISELLRFSNDNDIVDTSRYSGRDKQQQLANNLWHLNPNLNLVKTQLKQIDKTYFLTVEMQKGDQSISKKEFTGTALHNIVLDAVRWIGKENSHRNLDDVLLNMLPNDQYLVETYMRGFAFVNNGENSKAIEYFKLCLQEKPDFHLARISLAKALRRFSQYDESIVQLETLKSLNLNMQLSIVVDSEFAAVQLIRGHLPEAKAMFENIINNYPMSFRLYPAYMNLASTEYRLGNYDESMKQLQVLENIINEKTHPEDAAIIYFTMGGVFMYQKQLSESYKYLKKSLSLFKQANDLQREGMTLARISNYHMMSGDVKKADSYIVQSYQIANQLGNKRSQLAALNHMVQFKVIEGKFDQASELNLSLSNLAIELNSLSGKIRVAQWNAQLSIIAKQYSQAQKFIQEHLEMAQESKSQPSINSNLILQLTLQIAQKNNPQIRILIKQLQQKQDNDLLMNNFIPLYVEYLSANNEHTRAINYLQKQIQKAKTKKDQSFVQQLEISLAKEILFKDPVKAIKILKKIKINDLNRYPYHDSYARALFKAGLNIDALLQMEKAKQSYHQRWDQDMQQLYSKIKNAIESGSSLK